MSKATPDIEKRPFEERADRVLDVTGLDCPIPVLRARQALADMAAGQRLLVLATDPHSVVDFRAFCARTGHLLSTQEESGGTFHFLLEKAPKPQKT